MCLKCATYKTQSNLIHEFHTSTVEYSCFGIVRHTVADHQPEVGGYVIHRSVRLQVHLTTHRRKVHRMLYHIVVIWDLITYPTTTVPMQCHSFDQGAHKTHLNKV